MAEGRACATGGASQPDCSSGQQGQQKVASSRGPWLRDPARQTSRASTARQPSREGLQALLNTLPPDQRVMVVLSDVQGLSYQEIAELTGVSIDTIRNRLSQGRCALRDALLAQGAFGPGAPP